MLLILTRISVHFWFITKVKMANATLNKSFSAGSVVLVNVIQTTADQFRGMSSISGSVAFLLGFPLLLWFTKERKNKFVIKNGLFVLKMRFTSKRTKLWRNNLCKECITIVLSTNEVFWWNRFSSKNILQVEKDLSLSQEGIGVAKIRYAKPKRFENFTRCSYQNLTTEKSSARNSLLIRPIELSGTMLYFETSSTV